MAGNTLTEVQIFNAALLRLGETKGVTAVDGSDTSKYGTIAGSEYSRTRDEELRAHIWKFAVKRGSLAQAFTNGTGTWSAGSTTLTVTGIAIVTLTANTVTLSRTLSSPSLTPNPTWIGQTATGAGIPQGTVVQGIDYVNGKIYLSKPTTATATGVSIFLNPIQLGWYVTNALVPGNVSLTFPLGITANTFVASMSVAGATITVTLSNFATSPGVSQSLCFQPVNTVGYWYMYNEPADAIRDTDIYVILPNFVYMWPYSVIHQSSFPSRHEGAYIYTDLDPYNGNPYVAYVAQIFDTTLFDPLFTDALVIRLASKIALYVTGGDKLKAIFEAEYQALVSRAQIFNLMEMEMEIEGNVWWTDRNM